MEQEVRDQLLKAIRLYGRSILENPLRLRNLLKDFCYNKFKKEIYSIFIALEAGSYFRLAESNASGSESVVIKELIDILQEDYALEEKLALWSIESICIVMGIDYSLDIDSESDSKVELQYEIPVESSNEETVIQSEFKKLDALTEGLQEGDKAKVIINQKITKHPFKIKKHKYKGSLIFVLSIITIFLIVIVNPNFINKKTPQQNNTVSTSVDKPSKLAPQMILVEKGSFMMGGSGSDSEKPSHKVIFTYDFYIGKYEITFEEYDRFCADKGRKEPNDQGWGREKMPVIYVNWFDAIAYCNWMSEEEGLPKAYDSKGALLDRNGKITLDPSEVIGYRLPTEAEWEFAARGGNESKNFIYSGSNDLDSVGWYNSNARWKTEETGKKTANELKIHDMSGNVWEWCTDYYSKYSSTTVTNPYIVNGSERVVRGGSWYNKADDSRVSSRGSYSPETTFFSYIGFRICRTSF